jgi:glycosyltransferase involved in cell wall biosynthesis
VAPVVSVIIPTFNGARHIGATLESVLGQSYSNLEVIVVDDGSMDATAEIVAETAPQAHLIRQPNLGHPAARNAGVRASTGEFLSFLDHDDLWLPEKTASQLACFNADPSLDLVFGHIQNFFSAELNAEDRAQILSPMAPLPGLLQGAMLARRASFERVGPFNEQRVMGDFLDWYGRATLLNLRTHMQPETVLMRRLHAQNTQRTHKHLRRQTLEALKELLDRRREASVEKQP